MISGFLLFIIIIIFIICLVLITKASVALGKNHSVSSDKNLKDAYAKLTTVSVVFWFLIAASIILTILGFAAGGEEVEAAEVTESEIAASKGSSYSTVTIIFIIIMVFFLFVAGVVTIQALVAMGKSSNFNSNTGNDKIAYDDAVISAVVSLLTIFLLVIGYFAYSYYDSKDAEEPEDSKKEKKSKKKIIEKLEEKETKTK